MKFYRRMFRILWYEGVLRISKWHLFIGSVKDLKMTLIESKRDEISDTHNKERWFREFDIHGTCWS